ncbi:hypothetical protein WN51_07590 [Melipona quadrifasciata]|uniref:Uncharacterized protein n=1 Tax=Melipona quadrifasciata TaxID=166423 RepID=A0A0M8ZS16_9HYME|nr:hypothetical protein WN51_07590 [Melipona quadrifasciata]
MKSSERQTGPIPGKPSFFLDKPSLLNLAEAKPGQIITIHFPQQRGLTEGRQVSEVTKKKAAGAAVSTNAYTVTV